MKEMIKNKFSFVMPMVINHRTTEDNDLERILKIQLPTFKKYLKLDDLHKFYIITRSADIDVIKESLTKEYPEFPFVFIDEMELVPQLKTFPLRQFTVHPGWIIQQLVKFEIAKQMETEHYFSFETDLFLTKPFSYKDMFNDGKIICSHLTEMGKPTCEPWYMYAAALITPGIEEFIVDKDCENKIEGSSLYINKIMGVSPQIFITQEMLNLINHLEELHKMNYLDLLLRTTNGHPNTWTEYTLYWIWLFVENKMDLYSFESPYISSGELWTSNYRQGFHEKYFGEFDTLVMKNKNHYFNIIQSNILDIKLDYVVNKLKPYLE